MQFLILAYLGGAMPIATFRVEFLDLGIAAYAFTFE
jgi:hypothetical protein